MKSNRLVGTLSSRMTPLPLRRPLRRSAREQSVWRSDSVGGSATATLIQLLSDRGVLVTYASATGQPLAIDELQLIGKHLTVKGFFLGDYDHVSKVLPAQIEAAPLVASGALTVPVAAVYPIAKIKEALEHLHKGGKILLDFSQPQ
jgi:NADPH:quinone reductase-like Zn-dependent oxidoreductase